ncbi:MAG: cupin domain-containing protein [Chloroflexota bacterium]
MSNEQPWLFNLHDETQGLARKLAEGLTARIFVGDNAMLSVVNIEPHSQGKIHSHPEEQWGVLISGACTRIQDGVEIEAQAGDFWHTPGNVSHGIRTGESAAVVLDIFSPPRPEYRQKGEGFEAADAA